MKVVPSPFRQKAARFSWVVRVFVLAWVVLNTLPTIWGLPAAYRNLLNLEPNTGLPGWTQAELQAMTQSLGLSPQLLAGLLFAASLVCLISFWVIAGILFWKKGDSVVGLIAFFTLTGIGVGFSFLIPDTSSLTGWVKSLHDLHAILIWTTFFVLLYLFPDGRFVPRWARFLIPLPYGLFLLAAWYGDSAPGWFEGLALGWIVGGILSQIYRYKRVSTLEQRQQTKWIVFALGLFIVSILITEIPKLFLPSLNAKTAERFVFDIVFNYVWVVLTAALLPVAMGLSIFRYRLWDIDVIIRKTLVYVVVTGLLGLVYLGGVLLLQGLFARLGAGQSPVAIVLSTLLIVILFNPLRRKVQEGVDRRFYRRKYNAEGVLAAFTAKTRDEVDIERLSAALVGAVEETVQPERVSVWLKKVQQ